VHARRSTGDCGCVAVNVTSGNLLRPGTMKLQPRSCQIQNFDRLSFVNEGDSLEVGHTRAASSTLIRQRPARMDGCMVQDAYVFISTIDTMSIK